MVNIEISVTSKHTIRPSATSFSLDLLKPYKLSIFDQLTPTTYVPTIFFYPINDPNFNLPQTLADLKNALSHTLTLYYPFAGRTKNNLYVHDFDAGVPYFETRVNYSISQFLRIQETELLNDFVPFHPFRRETVASERLPLIGVQVNVFDDGIAIGVSASHKLIDGETANAFFKSWSAIFCGSRDKIVQPNLSRASLVFPPRDDLPEKYLALMDRTWFEEKNYVTRRFVFNAKAISKLRDNAKSEDVPKSSRIEALTGFLWKHQMAASRRASSSGISTKVSIAVHAVNMRPRMNMQNLLENVIGNIFWWAPVLLDLNDTPETSNHDLRDLVRVLSESIKEFNSEYLETLKGEDGFGGICDFLDLIKEAASLQPAPEIYAFTSWTRILDQVDFGWGRPFWIGVMGKVGPAFRNLTVFVETRSDQGIEAWVTLDQRQMTMLEKDPQFLEFARLNPPISSTNFAVIGNDGEGFDLQI